MKAKIFVVIMILFTCYQCYSQSTVYVGVDNFGRGILKPRAGECFAIIPFHLVKDKVTDKIVIIGEEWVESTGVLIQEFGDKDLGLVRLRDGGNQNCIDWDVLENYRQLLEDSRGLNMEIRGPKGLDTGMEVKLKKMGKSSYSILSESELSQGLSGSSLYASYNNTRVFMGMLKKVDGIDNHIGYVQYADVMMDTLGVFFDSKLFRNALKPPKRINAFSIGNIGIASLGVAGLVYGTSLRSTAQDDYSAYLASFDITDSNTIGDSNPRYKDANDKELQGQILQYGGAVITGLATYLIVKAIKKKKKRNGK